MFVPVLITDNNLLKNIFMHIKFIKALCGDAIIISFADVSGTDRFLVIDSGPNSKKSYVRLKREFQYIAATKRKIDLMVITHYDDDHIGGIRRMCLDNEVDVLSLIDKFWLNHSIPLPDTTSLISIKKLLDLKLLLQAEGKLPLEPTINIKNDIEFYGTSISILSPNFESYTKASALVVKSEKILLSGVSDHLKSIEDLIGLPFTQDTSIANGSSIAFLLECQKCRILLLADAYPDIIVQSLRDKGFSTKNPLKVDLLKVSHHGSKFNTSCELLSLIKCSHFVFSTNGHNRHNLPHKETLVRILTHPNRDLSQTISFYFSHDDDILRKMFSIDESPFERYNFTMIFPKEDEFLFFDETFFTNGR